VPCHCSNLELSASGPAITIGTDGSSEDDSGVIVRRGSGDYHFICCFPNCSVVNDTGEWTVLDLLSVVVSFYQRHCRHLCCLLLG